MFDSSQPGDGTQPRKRGGKIYHLRPASHYQSTATRKRLTRDERAEALAIRRQRYKLKLTLCDLGAASEVHHTRISAYEKLRVRLRPEQIAALKRALREAEQARDPKLSSRRVEVGVEAGNAIAP